MPGKPKVIVVAIALFLYFRSHGGEEIIVISPWWSKIGPDKGAGRLTA
jgi:hypothetical protein